MVSQKIVGPDGTENLLVSCMDIEQCYSQARQDCQGNYKIINTSSEVDGANGNTSTTTKLLIKCER